MRNVQLLQLVADFKAETGQSVLVSAGLDDLPAQQHFLRRTQEMLYDDFDWPHLRLKNVEIALAAGQRYYDVPASLNYERFEDVKLWIADTPYDIQQGIGAEEYALYNSDEGDRGSQVLAYDIAWTGTSEQIEVWPIPDDNSQVLKITGIRKLRPLIANDDVCDLDDSMIVLSAASEVLADQKSGKAQLIGQAAARRKRQMQNRSTRNSGRTILGGGTPAKTRHPVVIMVR